MATRNVTVPISTVTKNITLHLHITGLRRFAVRQWIGIQLIKLATRVMGMGFHFDLEEKR